ncbi:MAG: choline-sulfatase [Labrys sp. (in: a-proteobacteria)]
MRRPNILFILVDQLNGTLFPDGPAPFLKTPVLRALAARSTRFVNTYCASPLCAPSRASIMSGQLPSKTGVFDNAAEFASAIPTFAHVLRGAGYRTILSGKMHFVGPDQMHGFEERLTTDIYPADFGWTPDWKKPDERIDWWYHNLGSVTAAGTAEITNQLEYDDEVAFLACQKIHQLARRRDDRPFCLTVSFTHPHDPYVARQKYWDLYPEGTIPPVQTPDIAFDDQDSHSKRLFEMSDWQNFNLTPRMIADSRRAYCANMSYLDDKIGEILETLQACDLADDTVIVFTSDHGDMLGERGLWFKMSFFEGSIRVPLMISSPSIMAPGLVRPPVSTLDIFPTLASLARVECDSLRDDLDGEDLVAITRGRRAHGPVLAEYAAEGSIAPMVMVRDQLWKLVVSRPDPVQLFNLDEDPLERHNRAEDPSVQSVRQHLAALVATRWDLSSYEREVLRSQRRRLAIYPALRNGAYYPWDFQPLQRASERYMRNHMDLNVVESDARYPKPKS